MEDHMWGFECLRDLGFVIDEELCEQLRKAIAGDVLQMIVARALVLLDATTDGVKRAFIVQTVARAAWQHGYRAAPKLEFVLPEGAGG